MAGAVIFREGITSGQQVKAKQFPDFVLGNGPTQSITTWSKSTYGLFFWSAVHQLAKRWQPFLKQDRDKQRVRQMNILRLAYWLEL